MMKTMEPSNLMDCMRNVECSTPVRDIIDGICLKKRVGNDHECLLCFTDGRKDPYSFDCYCSKLLFF